MEKLLVLYLSFWPTWIAVDCFPSAWVYGDSFINGEFSYVYTHQCGYVIYWTTTDSWNIANYSLHVIWCKLEVIGVEALSLEGMDLDKLSSYKLWCFSFPYDMDCSWYTVLLSFQGFRSSASFTAAQSIETWFSSAIDLSQPATPHHAHSHEPFDRWSFSFVHSSHLPRLVSNSIYLYKGPRRL